ncbi:DNA gyrase subunit A [Bacillus phage vB_BanS_Skywalker]|uniref:DNA gyrase subunit A n=2 Tax=Tsamsavirus TaxID=3044849 RepID=A0AAE8YV69_9CAUD|nr:DNA gyrase subunit A [Bacillus phage vB_BanS_Skywalker]YP_010681013.1 DNA gyrase/topoisomerase IV, subunit A [Bacillus phage vB_BanS_MrDarsey]UGO47949.1 DNA gyrase/topoisomerase IV, subunit A [Bacillus phage vB_BanS_MrDarsey]UGO51308.1 DNA gyrase subunit A [Bacillus phage vB_BanS_Skywalker]
MVTVIEQSIIEALRGNYMPYTAHVILERALPEIDGFKPSQRRILETARRMGLLSGVRKKSQGIVGQTMFLHPHGDGAIYETLVRMARDAEALSYPLIDSKGNFGKQYSKNMQYASARYTEAKLEPIAKELFKDINKNTVDMIDSYDGTLKEPKLLPVTLPFILLNPQSGIANGMASSIAPFNLNEVVDYFIAYIRSPKTARVSDYIKAPDFSTGGNVIYDKNTFERIFETGRGTFTIRATYKFDKDGIIFEELPYTSTFEAIILKIAELVKDGKIKDITDVNDIYGIKSKGIKITTKKNTDKEALVEKLFRMTPLQSTYPCNFNIVVNGRPRVLGIQGIAHEWIRFRAEAIKRGLNFDMNKKIEKRHLLLALKQVLLDVDKAIKIIRETKTNKEVVANLMDAFEIDEKQAEYVSEIKLRHLNEEYLIERTKEIETLEDEVIDLKDLIGSRQRIAQLLIAELEEGKKNYGKERRTGIIEAQAIAKAEKEAVVIDDYNIKVFLTKEGYLKKIPLTSLRGNFTIKVKDGDEIVSEIDTTNNSDILVFTDKNNCYKYKMHEIEDSKPSLLGEYLPTMLGLKDEEIVFTHVTSDYKGTLLVGFETGKLAKIELSAYETKTNRKMLANAYYNGAKALYFNVIHEDIDIVMVSSINKVALFNTASINSKTSKTAQGNQLMRTKNDSIVESILDVKDCQFEDIEYYRLSNAGVGKYLKKTDTIVK